MKNVISKADGLVLMHMKGSPKTMQMNPTYDNVVVEVGAYLKEQARVAMVHGVSQEKIMLDPGIGLGKSFEHNIELTKNLRALKDLGFEVLYGSSRKSFLKVITGIAAEKDRDAATVGSICYAALNGAGIVRVHNVKMAVDALKVVDAFR